MTHKYNMHAVPMQCHLVKYMHAVPMQCQTVKYMHAVSLQCQTVKYMHGEYDTNKILATKFKRIRGQLQMKPIACKLEDSSICLLKYADRQNRRLKRLHVRKTASSLPIRQNPPFKANKLPQHDCAEIWTKASKKVTVNPICKNWRHPPGRQKFRGST